MSEIIPFSSLKKKNSPMESLNYEELRYYKGLLGVQAEIMDELFVVTEEILRKYECDINSFTLNHKSAIDFINTDMVEFVNGGEVSLGLIFDAKINEINYKTYACAMYEDESISVDAMLLKYDNNLDEWLVKCNGDWERGPGKNFF